MSCINRNLQEYKDLKNSLGSNDLELNLIIKKFNKVTGNEETYLPKASELKEFKDSQKFKSQTFSQVRSRPIRLNEVDYTLKSVEILSSDKAEQVFAKGKKNNWDLNKILTELQVPKEQKQIILDKDINNREEIITSLLADNSFTVEINTATTAGSMDPITGNEVQVNGIWFRKVNGQWMDSSKGYENETPATKEQIAEINKQPQTPATYYSNLTVPGGTNYRENEIATPDITPSIKGHAEFATDKGIGWFRSDDKATGPTYKFGNFDIIETKEGKYEVKNKDTNKIEVTYNTSDEAQEFIFNYRKNFVSGQATKTRRILEVQSDLFQKSRDNKELVTEEVDDIKDNFILNGVEYYRETMYGSNTTTWFSKIDNTTKEGYMAGKQEISFEEYKDAKKEAGISDKSVPKKENQFLQLLNKKGNWVNFFIQSIVQDSVKKGYEKVLFPKGDTASKIEGHTTLEEFKKQKEDRIKLKTANNEQYQRNIDNYNENIQEIDKQLNTVPKRPLLEVEVSRTGEIKLDGKIVASDGKMLNNTYTVTLQGLGERIYKNQGDYNTVRKAIRNSYKKAFKQKYDTSELQEEKVNLLRNIEEQQRNINNNQYEINQLKQELERIETEGFGALKPIYNFYQNTVTNILKKKYNVTEVTDEYGNTWNEIDISDMQPSTIFLEKKLSMSNIKPGVGELFESNPELADIGTQEQYSQYLDTIFPDSQVEDIVYHGAMEQLLPKDGKFKGYVTYFTDFKKYAETFGFPVNRKVVSAVVNVQRPFNSQSELADVPLEVHVTDEFTNPRIIKSNTKGYDSVIGIDAGQKEGKTIAIFEPEQIHLLGSKQDIEGFKEFVGRQYQKPAQTKKRSDARVNLRSFNSDTEVLKGESEKIGQEPTELTLRQVLDQVNKGASPIVKYVLKLIQKHIPEGLTIVVQDDVVENDEDGNPISVNGVYDGARNVIRVSRQATNLESTLLHELIHAGTIRIFKAYRENPSMFKGKEYANIMRFMSLWERVRKQAIKDGVELGQAAESVEEFITALYTNKEVQEYLAGIKPEIENNNNESWLTKLINSLLDILGFSNESSALREAVKLSGLMLGTMVTDTRQVVISERYNELSQEDYNILTSQFTGENITKEQKEVASKLMLESKSFSLSDDGVNYSDKSGNLYKRVSNWIQETFPDYAFEDTNNDYTKNRSWGNQIDEILSAVILEKELDEDLKNTIRSRAETYEDGALIKDEVIEKVYDYFNGWVQEKREQGYIVLPQMTIGNPDVEGGGVAGTLDVALVDDKGVLHIVDLKSSINSVHGDKYTSYKISKKKRHTASMSSYKGLAHSLGIQVSPKLDILPVKLDNLDEQGEDLGEVQDVEFEDIVQLTPNLNFVRPLAVQTSEKSTFREDARYNSLMEKILVTLKNKAIELKNSGKTDFFVEELIDRLQTMEPLLAVEAFVDDAFTQFEGEEGKFYGYSDSIKFLIKSKDSIEEKLKRAEELQSTMYLYDKVFDEIKEIYDRLVMEEAIEVFEGSTLDKLNQLIIKSTTEKNNINNLLVDLQAQVLADASPQSAELSAAVKEQIKKLKKQLEAAQGVYEQSKKDGKPQRVLVRQKNKITNLKNLIEKLGDQSGLDAKDFKKELLYGAEQDIDFVDLWVRPFIQSPSKVLANFTRKIKQAFEKARITSWEASMDFTKGFEKFRDYQKSLGISQGNVAEFNKKFYKVVGKHYSYVSNIDFEKYRLARNELYETLKQMEESGATQDEISSVRKSWYKNNTTNLPMQDVTVTNPITKETVVMIKGLETIRAERLEIFRGNEQKTDRWMRAAAAKGELSMPNANFKDNTIDNFTAQEKEYYDLLMYYHFSALQNYPEVNLSTSFKVPSIAKVSNDRVRENGIVNYLKYKFGSSYQEVSEDIEMYGAKNKVIPLTYMQPMDIEDVSLDLGSSTMRFYDASLQYKARVELKSLGDSLLRTVQKTKPNETGTAGKVLSRAAKALGMEIPDKKEGQSNIEFALTELIAHLIYGKNSKREIVYGKDANKIVGSLMGIASFTQIGGNPLLSAANVVVGNLSNLIESAAGKHFNTKNWAKALVEYETNEVNFIKDFTNPVNKSKLGQLVDIYDALQGEYKDKFGRKLTMGGMKKAWSKDTWFYLQHKGEHQVQVTAMIAKMLSTPATLNGKQINLLEAYSIGKDGKLTIDPNTIVNGKKVGNQLVIPEVQSSLHRINKDMHGVYNSFDSPLLERYSVGKLLMMYRKFVVPGFMRRFSGMRVEQESGELLEGYWRTFANLMLNDFTELRKFLTPGTESQLTSLEKENVKRTLTEMGIIVALLILSFAFGKMTDDEDEDSALYYPYYLAYRVRTEMMFFFNPLDTLRMFRTPTIAYSVVEKLMRLLIQLTNPFETYQRRSGMAKKGDNKLKIKTLKLLGINGYTLNPKEALDMMKMFTN